MVNQYGTPVRDAVVTPQGVLLSRGDGTTVYGDFGSFVAVSDEKGEFEITYAEPILRMALMVELRAMAPQIHRPTKRVRTRDCGGF